MATIRNTSGRTLHLPGRASQKAFTLEPGASLDVPDKYLDELEDEKDPSGSGKVIGVDKAMRNKVERGHIEISGGRSRASRPSGKGEPKGEGSA